MMTERNVQPNSSIELWDLYDRNRHLTGREHIRGQRLPEGGYHLVVHVWIRNSRGQYLISRRSANRPTNPLKWECVGGSVLIGESSLEGALRETREEVGVELDASSGQVLFTRVRCSMGGEDFQDIMDVWLFRYDGQVSLTDATTDEVCQVEWMEPEKIRRLYDQGELVDALDYFFCVMDRPEPDYGAIIGRQVRGRIDRPAGSTHPQYPEMVYTVNYGYVEEIAGRTGWKQGVAGGDGGPQEIPGRNGWQQDVTGGDGRPQDAYYLGTLEPVEQFRGTVIGVYYRFNDVEDKWIVAEEGSRLTDDEILGAIAFQEQYFYGKLYRKQTGV